MRFAHFFVDRPIFATVISILIVLIGLIAFRSLPVSQYPEIAPPTIQVSASYPGASAEVVAATVATPLEQEINGVENMLYVLSQSTADGRVTLRVTFKLGTDLDEAQVLVQNRVAIAEPRLPETVRSLGVTTTKSSPDLMMVVHLKSEGGALDQLYISNYAFLRIRDVIARIDGVGSLVVFGASEYSMRVWLEPDHIASFGLTAGDVVAALRAQNLQVASGRLNVQPTPDQDAFELAVQTQGRLTAPEEFGNIVVKEEDGRIVRVRDIGRVELGAQDYVTNSYLDNEPAVALAIFQRPGSNALETADNIIRTVEELSKDFPEGLGYRVVYNPTEFIAESVNEVYKTIFEAVGLVVLVVFVFLQSLRGALIPVVAIPISLIGTFAIMAAFGFSLNNLTLFGLVLAIGIVVDDAIVVVENIERNLREGLSPKDAAHKTMDEVGGALISIALVLSAVFIPTAFVTGITGQFYRQFALTIAVATIISAFVSLTLSPALAAILLEPHKENGHKPRGPARLLGIFFDVFNAGFERLASAYGALTRRLVRLVPLVLVAYVALIGLTAFQFQRTPTGFIPEQDQGYFIGVVQLPPASSLSRTDDVVRRAVEEVKATPGVRYGVSFAGFNGATFTNATNAGIIFIGLENFEERKHAGLTAGGILGELNGRMQKITDAQIFVVAPPPVRGIGNAGGFKMMIQDRSGRGLTALQDATMAMMFAANEEPGLANVFSVFEVSTPQLYADIDRTRAQMLGVPIDGIFEALSVYLGSSFVNDFNYLGRTYRVTAQADYDYRRTTEDIASLRTRNATGDMVPIGSVAEFEYQTGSSRVPRYNLYPAAELQGASQPGTSSGEAIAKMERLAEEVLPPGFGYEWTELAYQEKIAGNSGLLVFGLSVVFVFLVLAAQYESWLLPIAIVLIVPMCLLAAITGVGLRGMDNNILTQIGLIVLVGLAAKNAILIVEFARQLEDQGRDRFEAAVEAAGLRLRPILMTSLAFILGVVPLMLASGAGAEMRQSLGTAVFSGMLGVTFFGLILTPVFYVLCRTPAAMQERRRAARAGAQPAAGARAP